MKRSEIYINLINLNYLGQKNFIIFEFDALVIFSVRSIDGDLFLPVEYTTQVFVHYWDLFDILNGLYANELY